MGQLFTRLTEEFDNRTGTLINYVDFNGNPLATNRHYDIRSFFGDDITVPRTMLDMDYNSVTSLDTTQMIVLDTPRIIQGHSYQARTQASLDALNQSGLDIFSQSNLELIITATGNENWTNDVNIIVGKDSAERFANSIQVNLTAGVTKTAASVFTDNLFQSFDSPSSTYTIELALPAFPAQAAGAHLDLANSFIDFTSDPGYAAGQTDSIAFNQSTNSLTAGGDTFFSINRNLLTHVDLSNIVGIRFRLLAVGGNFTFKAQAMRLIKTDEFTFSNIDINTKRATFRRSVPRNSGTEPGPSTNPVFLADTRPKNGTLVAKFNSGHLDASSANINELRLVARKSAAADTYIKGYVQSYAGATRLALGYQIAGVTTLTYDSGLTLPALTPESDYLLVLEFYEGKNRVTLYKAFGALYGAVVATSGLQTTTIVQRGLIGIDFRPYNYDFSVDYLTAGDAEFGRIASNGFNSITPVIAASISTQDKAPVDLTQGLLQASGDATLTSDTTRGLPSPASKIVRTGVSFTGGLSTSIPIFIGNTKYLKISGDIFPSPSTGSSLRGKYRIAFVDKNGSVGWIGYLNNVTSNQWSHFDIPVSASLVPANYTVLIEQAGFFGDTFYLDNFSVNHLSMAYEVSPDNGTTWYPFLTAKDSQYSAASFINAPGKTLVVKGIALSDTAWVSRYELVPVYAYPGHTP